MKISIRSSLISGRRWTTRFNCSSISVADQIYLKTVVRLVVAERGDIRVAVIIVVAKQIYLIEVVIVGLIEKKKWKKMLYYDVVERRNLSVVNIDIAKPSDPIAIVN